MASFLCQYHDDTPEDISKLDIDPFSDFPEGKPDRQKNTLANAHAFLLAWNRLKYNLVTNDGEQFIAKEAQDFIEDYASSMSRHIIGREAELQQKV